ncbi:MAG TPA: putative DNA modification/repair radical SAM protein [Methanobacterium sp.]|nr:putative DNA modification/repair radical SAM protein [Methanobacterium sp.]
MTNRAKKLDILGKSAKFDRCNYINTNPDNFLLKNLPGIYQASTQNGCTIPLFKVLMTNKCSNDCRYCVNHDKHQFNRVEFSPADVTEIFLEYYQNRLVEGLFLSSGIPRDAESSMENMVEVAHRLRKAHGYQGYIHLKILPGSPYDLIKRAVSLADRVSINLESATKEGMAELSSTKNYHTDILRRIKWIQRLLKKNKDFAPSGQTTQFIVGAGLETDEQILNRTNWLYQTMDLKRSYFSPFEAVKDTPLENHNEPHPKRNSRLYQADYLLNSYGFKLEELVFDDEGNLDLEFDPKFLAAQKYEDLFPMDINEAPYKELLRVPGIGRISARRIIQSRKKGINFVKLEELKKIGVVVKRAEPFIKLNKNYQSTLEILI